MTLRPQQNTLAARLIAGAAAMTLVFGLTACGKKGTPKPPSAAKQETPAQKTDDDQVLPPQ